MIKKFVMLLGGMFFTVAVYAAASQLRPGHPDTYTVRKGDTLWAISSRFLSKPWLWPEIWQANPQVRNPHLIYPGDVLNLSLDGTGATHVGLEPRVREEGEPITAIPLGEVRTFLKEMRVMNSDEVEQSPYVVGFEESRLRGTPGAKIYARDLDSAQPGQRWAIVRPTQRFRQHAGDGHTPDELTRPGQGSFVADELDSDVSMTASPWHEDSRHDTHYWGKGSDRGTEVTVIGTAEVVAHNNDVTTLVGVDSTREIRKGDRLMPVDDKPYDPYFYPHAPKSMPADPRVIAFTDARNTVGAHQVVAISAGSAQGVDNGTTFTVMAQGDRISDDVSGNSDIRGSQRTVQLPDEFAGHLMVFRTFENVSYALLMDATRPVHRGDRLVLPE
ncbi:LysM peptidoglycan-binding domain-containing protein [Luteibacter aegosomatis]|uniref:LysM peptidoglycan-binding domain-containing protein n=1 Tax=Luteibacter aegosomatis TaxID=2911537 RepID=UPI001FFA2F55|nr:LysM peptidoglycan-binding domain-containing protein [Luteibacter aegosomatis]UPG86016.1 LysM peptidoglycan-binding domain-containing protein [Luteibacter aegosomatis]